LCKDSLGKHWETRSEDERKEFTKTLKALIEKNLINRLKNTKERKIKYQSESLDGNKAQVLTEVATGDDPRADTLEIEYKMQKGRGTWGIVDMVTDGVSLVSNYRSQFNKIITEDGWDTLMKKMKDKHAEQS
jgi:phospholipid transport system substrate-binding protein